MKMAQLRYHPTPMQLSHSVRDHQMAFPIIEITGPVAEAIRHDLATKFMPIQTIYSPTGEDVFITRWMGQGSDPMMLTKKSGSTILCNKINLFLNAERAFRAGATSIKLLYNPFLTEKRIAFDISKTHTSAIAAYVRFNPFPNWRQSVDWSSPTADISIYATTTRERSHRARFREFIIRCPPEYDRDRNTNTHPKIKKTQAQMQSRHTEGSDTLPSSGGPGAPGNTHGSGREGCTAEGEREPTTEEATNAIGCTRRKSAWISIPLKRHQSSDTRSVYHGPYHRAPKTTRWPVARLRKIQQKPAGQRQHMPSDTPQHTRSPTSRSITPI